MRTETKKQIREAVIYDMAPANAGQVSLEDVGRVFRGRGELKEIEQCLDELVSEGLAKKTDLSGRTYYVFESIARSAATGNERRLREVEKEQETLGRETEQMLQLLKEESSAMGRLRPIWFNGLEKFVLDAENLARLQAYMAAFFDKHTETHNRRLKSIQHRIQELALERERRLRWKEETFIAVRASP